MDRIKSLLARSQTVKTTYEFSRQKISRLYRRANSTSNETQYQELADESLQTIAPYGQEEHIFTSDLRLTPHPAASNPVLTKDDITDCWTRFVADPFLVYEHGLYHLFFEIKSVGGDVFIGHAFSEDGLQYEYNQIVLQPEVAQHTYPHVFKWRDEWLMLPSPGSNVKGEFRIYQATDFPTDWELISTPIQEGVRVDPTPILHNDIWFLIYQETGSYDVVLKYADSLIDGNWTDHPSSPLFRADTEQIKASTIGKAEMAPSGRPVYTNGAVHLFYRSHLNREVYHYRVTEATTTSFQQERHSPSPVFDGLQTESWNQRFMHTVNPVYPWKSTINLVAVDGLAQDTYEYSIGIYSIESV